MNRLSLAVGIVSVGIAAFAVEPTIDESGNYVFTVESGEETYSGVLSGTVDVIKEGDGKLTLTGANTLTGTYRVNVGTLQMGPTAHPGDGSTKPSLVVSDGATFISDGANPAGAWSKIPFETITLTGKGVNDQGAFVRQNDSTGQRSEGLKIKLLGDTLINVKSQWNPGAVNLNGYKLTKIGSGSLDGYNATFTADGDGGKGAVHIAAGSYLNQNRYNMNGGSSENVFEMSGGATYDLYYSQWYLSKWLMKISGNATICAHQGDNRESARWGGPVAITGGDLTLKYAGDGHPMTFEGPIIASNGYGIVAATRAKTTYKEDVDLGSGALTTSSYWVGDQEFQKTFKAGSMSVGRIDNGTATPKFTFKGDATVGNVTLGTAVVAEFQGDTSLTGTVHAGKSTLRFNGCDNVNIKGVIGDSDKTKIGRYEFIDVGHVEHAASVQLNGSQSSTEPTVFYMTNSVWNGGSTEFIVTYNYCPSVLDLCDSVFTNATWLGGRSASQWAGNAALYQRGGSFYGPLHLNAQPGNAAYIKESGSFDNGSKELQIGGNGFGAVHLLSGDNQIGGSLKLESSGEYSTNGGTVYYQAGGSNTIYCLYQAATKANCSSTFVMTGSNTVMMTREWCQHMMVAAPDLGFKCVTAINDGARFVTARLARKDGYVKTAGSTSKWDLSFDGGIIAQTYQGPLFMNADRAPDKVIVQAGGVGIDSSGCSAAVTFSTPFECPTGKVIESIDLPTDEAFKSQVYLTPVKVEINGAGEGAAAVAILDKEKRTIKEIRVVARGTGYDDDTTATIEASSHNCDVSKQVRYTCAVHLADAPTTGAGFRKLGAGTVTFNVANTYKGPTVVEQGNVKFSATGALPEGSDLVLFDATTVNFQDGYGAKNEQVVVPTLESSGAVSVWGVWGKGVKVTGELKLHPEAGKKLHVDGPLYLADGVTISGIDVSKLDTEKRNVILDAANGGIVAQGQVNLPELPEDWKITISGNDLCVRKQRGCYLFVR